MSSGFRLTAKRRRRFDADLEEAQTGTSPVGVGDSRTERRSPSPSVPGVWRVRRMIDRRRAGPVRALPYLTPIGCGHPGVSV